MDGKEYQEMSDSVNIGSFEMPTQHVPGMAFYTIGMCGEAGEVAEKVKKIYRDSQGQISQPQKQAIVKELGDVMWYISQIARCVGSDVDEVMQENVKKLSERKSKGRLRGSGDDR